MDHVIINHQEAVSGLWLIGFMFTLGYLRLGLGKGLLALIIWPFFLGQGLRTGEKKL